jgi:hypothetical protein
MRWQEKQEKTETQWSCMAFFFWERERVSCMEWVCLLFGRSIRQSAVLGKLQCPTPTARHHRHCQMVGGGSKQGAKAGLKVVQWNPESSFTLYGTCKRRGIGGFSKTNTKRWRTENGDQRGGEWEPQISFEIFSHCPEFTTKRATTPNLEYSRQLMPEVPREIS